MRLAFFLIAAITLSSPSTALALPGEQKIDCKVGTENEHARIAVHIIQGKVLGFAFYSKWKPRTCSVDADRDDRKSRWRDLGGKTSVTFPKGQVDITQSGQEVSFRFIDVDRSLYCGMPGKLNGVMKVNYASTSKCTTHNGLMDRDPPEIIYEERSSSSGVAPK